MWKYGIFLSLCKFYIQCELHWVICVNHEFMMKGGCEFLVQTELKRVLPNVLSKMGKAGWVWIETLFVEWRLFAYRTHRMESFFFLNIIRETLTKKAHIGIIRSFLWITRKCPLRGHCLAPPGGLRAGNTQEVIPKFFKCILFTLNTYQVNFIMTFCDKTAGIGVSFWTDRNWMTEWQMDRQTWKLK